MPSKSEPVKKSLRTSISAESCALQMGESSSMTAFLRGNPGLVAWLGIFSYHLAVVLTISAYLMNSRGLVAEADLVVRGIDAAGWVSSADLPCDCCDFRPRGPPRRHPGGSAPGSSGIHNPELLFTTAPEGATVVDIPPQSAAGLFARAETGSPSYHEERRHRDDRPLRIQRSGRPSCGRLPARIGSRKQCATRWRRRLHHSWKRSAVGRVYARGNVLVVHTTVDDSSVAPGRVPAPTTDPMKRLTASTSGKVIAASALVLYTLFVSVYFLKGSAWATRVDAKPVERALSASELRERLLALNTLDIPFRIEVSSEGELFAIWKYAEAKWRTLGARRWDAANSPYSNDARRRPSNDSGNGLSIFVRLVCGRKRRQHRVESLDRYRVLPV